MLTPVENIIGDDDEDTKLLVEMAEMARNYVTSHEWCLPISSMYLAFGVGGMVAVFLVKFEGKIGGAYDRLWVFVGDLPPAFMTVEDRDSPQNALEGYCQLMDDWANSVLAGGDLRNAFPVSAEPTKEHADMLRGRLEFIRKEIIPNVTADAIGG